MTQVAELVVIHTDGACSGNPGPGGWGAIMRSGKHEREIMGGEPDTTNNRMELMAAIKALEALRHPCRVCLYTDSTYLCNGITRWITAWKSKGWKTSARKPVKNIDLWQRLETAMERHEIHWEWVKGHAGNSGNERADEIARLALRQACDSALI